MEDGVGNGRRNANHSEFAHALDAEWVDDFIVLLNEYRFNLQDIGINRT